MDTRESSALAHPSTEAHDQQDERPHACTGGWVFLTVEENGIEYVEAVRCRRCAEAGSV